MIFIYSGPNGEFIKHPTAELLEEIVYNDASYWASGGGDSSLYFEGSDTRLIFFKDKSFGIFLMKLPDYTAPCCPLIDVKLVYHRVGGEKMTVPSCSFISEKKTLEYLMEFSESGNIRDFEIWKDIYEIIEYED